MGNNKRYLRKFWLPLAVAVIGVILVSGLVSTKLLADSSPSNGFRMVHIVNYRFVPNTVTIHPGDAVTWTNNDDIDSDIHEVRIYNSSCCVDSFDIVTGQVFTRRFSTPGQYIVVLSENQGLIGRVIVEPATR